jgi:RNA polymerase sigma-70 factor (ECF subfamily)
VRGESPSETDAFLARLRAGEAQAFEDMVKSYQHRVYGVALRMMGDRAEAEEVAQETFLRAHRALAEFRGDARLSTWLYAIASRLCL